MFISLSKTIGRVGGFRFGVGKRITAKNAWWMFLILAFVYLGQLMWYMCVVMFWLMYAMFYGMWWLMKAMVKGIIALFSGGAAVAGKAIEAKRENDARAIDTARITETKSFDTNSFDTKPHIQPVAFSNTEQSDNGVNKNKFCPECGKPITPGNRFCIGCGKPVS